MQFLNLNYPCFVSFSWLKIANNVCNALILFLELGCNDRTFHELSEDQIAPNFTILLKKFLISFGPFLGCLKH